MDDDGLLLNFAEQTSRTPLQNTHKRLEGRKNGRRKHSRNDPTSLVTPDSGPAKPKNGEASKTNSAAKVGPSDPSQKEADYSRPKNSVRTHDQSSSSLSIPRKKSASTVKKADVISSLFSRGSALDEVSTTTEAANDPVEPTNAPSTGSSFASLGLDPLICQHLSSSKMNIVRPTGIQRKALNFLLPANSSQRDALLHAQTGSGKTLCYLLPILQSLLPLCETSWIDRSCLGTLAIILAPTRELARQIYEVAESLVSLHLGGEDGSAQVRRTRWIVPGLLSGGSTKNHEKSRIRKGIPLMVATPGRLLDHLRNTASLEVGRLQWLILDEADRLLQMGFEETLTDIMKAIEGRRRAACDVQRKRLQQEMGNQIVEGDLSDSNVTDTFGEKWWRLPRRTVLCSATLDEGVQVLAGKALNHPRIIRSDLEDDMHDLEQERHTEHKALVATPGQLIQNYVESPPKQRLIMLVALLRRAVTAGKNVKVMVFVSCTDSVDFHLNALAGVNMARGAGAQGQEEEGSVPVDLTKYEHSSQLLPSTSLFRLHGSMSQQARQASLRGFVKNNKASVLLCTSVASRGLDLHVTHVVQLDPPTERGADEYIHRIGRTARAGGQGESWLILLPNESKCIEFYQQEMSSNTPSTESCKIRRCDASIVLREGFGGLDMTQTQNRATDAQMALERWTLANEGNAQRARQAYLAHLRAYATHPPSERFIFSISDLQLGHLAKAFALREAPGVIRSKVQQYKIHSKNQNTSLGTKRKRRQTKDSQNLENTESDDENDGKLSFARNEETEARMYAKVRELGKLHKRGGVLGAHGGVDEFQIG